MGGLLGCWGWAIEPMRSNPPGSEIVGVGIEGVGISFPEEPRATTGALDGPSPASLSNFASNRSACETAGCLDITSRESEAKSASAAAGSIGNSTEAGPIDSNPRIAGRRTRALRGERRHIVVL